MHTADDIWWREKSCKGAAIQYFFLSSGKRYGKMKQKTIQNQTTKRKRDHDMKYMFASDIHGSAYYCRKMLEAFQEEKAVMHGLIIRRCSIIFYLTGMEKNRNEGKITSNQKQ